VEIRKAGQMEECQGLVLPGGESTAIFRQLERSGLTEELKAAAVSQKADTCHLCRVGAVSKEIDGGRAGSSHLGLMDIKISRKAFGPQRESFEADLEIEGLERTLPGGIHPCSGHSRGAMGCRCWRKSGTPWSPPGKRISGTLPFTPSSTDDSRVIKYS